MAQEQESEREGGNRGMKTGGERERQNVEYRGGGLLQPVSFRLGGVERRTDMASDNKEEQRERTEIVDHRLAGYQTQEKKKEEGRRKVGSGGS